MVNDWEREILVSSKNDSVWQHLSYENGHAAYFPFFPHRAVAALRAIFERCAVVRLRAVAFPPLRSRETAAGFFLFTI
jgi:hypothetical protein